MDIKTEIEELKKRLNRIEIQLNLMNQTKLYGQPIPSQTSPRTETVFTPRLFDSGKRTAK